MDSEEIKELAIILNDSAKSGYAILQNLLDWSRSQTGLLKFNPGRINLNDLINNNISNLQFLADNKEINLHFEAEGDIYIITDENMINTVLRNLISNSIKFTHKGGKINIGSIVNPDEVIVSVKDNGIGIPQDAQRKLFKPEAFHSTEGTNNEKGSGLGLLLCKEFIEMHGGNIRINSEPGKGSKFTFSMPHYI